MDALGKSYFPQKTKTSVQLYFSETIAPKCVIPIICFNRDFPVAQMVKRVSQMVKQCRRPRLDLWVGKIPWRRKWQPTPVVLPEKLQGLSPEESGKR